MVNEHFFFCSPDAELRELELCCKYSYLKHRVGPGGLCVGVCGVLRPVGVAELEELEQSLCAVGSVDGQAGHVHAQFTVFS